MCGSASFAVCRQPQFTSFFQRRHIYTFTMLFRLIVTFTIFTMAACDMSAISLKTADLTKVTWAHAVNNDSLLQDALKSDVNMLEADISIGKLSPSDKEEIPIMAHPPAKISDLSLKDFLIRVNEHNKNDSRSHKGVKLDFKSFQAFNASVPIMKDHLKDLKPVWLNADILPGPVNATAIPVDAHNFLTICNKEFTNITLSIGWTTLYNTTYQGERYEMNMIEEMVSKLHSDPTSHNVTFPVRAGLTAESLEEMKTLLANVTDSTLTIWSSADDPVDAKKLRSLILDIGLNKVYLDVPKELRDKLNLPGSGSRVTSFGLMSALSLFLILNKMI